jgi:chromosome segregation ATPase
MIRISSSIVIFIGMITLSLAGNIPQLEKQLEREIFELSQVQKKLDSLQVKLDSYSRQIEMEKSQGTVNEKKIRSWFEMINHLSQDINIQEKKSRTIQQKIFSTRTELDKHYTIAIDSLQELSRLTSDQQQQAELNAQIIEITEKRITVLPVFKAFSFDPQKISEMSLQETSDSLEFAIYLDYLTNARKEVQGTLRSIEITRKEIDDLLWLQQRSNHFLEELDENRPLAFFSQTVETGSTPQNTYTTTDLSDGSQISIQTQAQSLFNLLSQLPGETPNFSWVAPLDSGRVFLTLKDYRNALKNAEKSLKNYQKVLDHKINAK